MDGFPITALLKQQVILLHSDFPVLLTAHLRQSNKAGPNVPKGTQALEADGYTLRTSSPMVWANLEAFIKDVCRWGDYAGISGRVLKNNARSHIKSKVGNAISLLSFTPPDLAGALNSVREIKGLGSVSFASKHLRFLFPEHCPVLDSILSSRLLYDLSTDGYLLFASACQAMAEELNKAKISTTFPGQSFWRPSDVEAALYAWVNEWK